LLAAARKYALIICMHLLAVIRMWLLESSASAYAIFMTRGHKSTNLTHLTSICTKELVRNDRKEVCAYLRLCA